MLNRFDVGFFGVASPPERRSGAALIGLAALLGQNIGHPHHIADRSFNFDLAFHVGTTECVERWVEQITSRPWPAQYNSNQWIWIQINDVVIPQFDSDRQRLLSAHRVEVADQLMFEHACLLAGKIRIPLPPKIKTCRCP